MPKPGTDSKSQEIPFAGWFVLIIIGLAVAWILGVFDRTERTTPEPDNSVIVDQDKQLPTDDRKSNSNLKDCVLIVVHDKKSTSENPEYTRTLQDDAFWEQAAKRVKDVEFVEDDDDLGKKVLATAGPAPAVVLFNVASKKIEWSIPLPKGTTEPIAKRLQ